MPPTGTVLDHLTAARAALDAALPALTGHLEAAERACYDLTASSQDPVARRIIDALEALEDADLRIDDALATERQEPTEAL